MDYVYRGKSSIAPPFNAINAKGSVMLPADAVTNPCVQDAVKATTLAIASTKIFKHVLAVYIMT